MHQNTCAQIYKKVFSLYYLMIEAYGKSIWKTLKEFSHDSVVIEHLILMGNKLKWVEIRTP